MPAEPEFWTKRPPEPAPVKVTRIGNFRRACLWLDATGWHSCNPCDPSHDHTGGNTSE